MASFSGHLSVGIATSGIAATAALLQGYIDQPLVIPLFIAGTLGSLLPDLDADHSTVVRITFSLIALLAAFLVMLSFAHQLTLLQLILVWIGCFLLIRYGCLYLFTHLTVHRGMLHSIPAALIFGALTSLIAHHLLQLSSVQAWFYGGFVTFGYLIHLILDEIYSIDLMGMTVKRSAFSALKLYTRNSWSTTFAFYLVMLMLLAVMPNLKQVILLLSQAIF